MLLDRLRVLLFPISLSDDHVRSSLRPQQFLVLLPSDDVQERNSESDAPFVEHPSESRGCSCVDYSSFVAELFVDVRHSDSRERIDDSGSCGVDWDILVDGKGEKGLSERVLGP